MSDRYWAELEQLQDLQREASEELRRREEAVREGVRDLDRATQRIREHRRREPRPVKDIDALYMTPGA